VHIDGLYLKKKKKKKLAKRGIKEEGVTAGVKVAFALLFGKDLEPAVIVEGLFGRRSFARENGN
jgi:hypothetical protein